MLAGFPKIVFVLLLFLSSVFADDSAIHLESAKLFYAQKNYLKFAEELDSFLRLSANREWTSKEVNLLSSFGVQRKGVNPETKFYTKGSFMSNLSHEDQPFAKEKGITKSLVFKDYSRLVVLKNLKEGKLADSIKQWGTQVVETPMEEMRINASVSTAFFLNPESGALIYGVWDEFDRELEPGKRKKISYIKKKLSLDERDVQKIEIDDALFFGFRTHVMDVRPDEGEHLELFNDMAWAFEEGFMLYEVLKKRPEFLKESEVRNNLDHLRKAALVMDLGHFPEVSGEGDATLGTCNTHCDACLKAGESKIALERLLSSEDFGFHNIPSSEKYERAKLVLALMEVRLKNISPESLLHKAAQKNIYILHKYLQQSEAAMSKSVIRKIPRDVSKIIDLEHERVGKHITPADLDRKIEKGESNIIDIETLRRRNRDKLNNPRNGPKGGPAK